MYVILHDQVEKTLVVRGGFAEEVVGEDDGFEVSLLPAQVVHLLNLDPRLYILSREGVLELRELKSLLF